MLSPCRLMDPRLTDAVYLLMMSATIFIIYGADMLSVDHFISSILSSDENSSNAAQC
jgi:hypothetical protein